MRRSPSRWLIWVGAFGVGLMLAILIFPIKPFALAQSELLAPVITPHPSAIRASVTNWAIAPRPINDSAKIPNALKICLSASGERLDVWGTVTEKTNRVYLLGIYSDFVNDNPFDTTDELIVLHSTSIPWCERWMPQAGLALKPLNAFMSSAAALKLEQQRYQHYIARLGGVQQFQQRLNQQIVESKGDYWLSEEQVEVLHQLGIQLPKNYRLLRQTTFPDLGGSP